MNNIGKANRIARGIAVAPLTMCAMAGPYPLALRLAVFALPGLYLAVTSLVGSCAVKSLVNRVKALGERS